MGCSVGISIIWTNACVCCSIDLISVSHLLKCTVWTGVEWGVVPVTSLKDRFHVVMMFQG